MKKILLNNLSLKLLALLLGIVLWIAVMYNLNPMTTKTIDVPVHIENDDVLKDKNWIYTIEGDSEIKVNVKAKSLDLAKITADDIYLYVDMKYLSGNSGTERQGAIRYNLRNTAIEGITYEQDYLRFNLEEIITRDFKVDVQVMGDVAENYTKGDEPTAVPEYVTIKGPKSQVEQIAKVVYYLALDDANEDINIVARPILVDAKGETIFELTDTTITPEEVQICMPIYQTKVVPIECAEDIKSATVGEPATGYGVSEIVLDTESIKVAGYKAILANVISIEIPPELLNVEGLTETQTFKINLEELNIPDGVTLLGDDHIVNVTVKLEKKKQNNFRLKLPDDITITNKNEDYIYTFSESSIYITVEGIGKELSELEAANIISSIDVFGLEIGEYTLPLNVKLPEGINLVSAVNIKVIISEEESTTETESVTVPLPPTVPPTVPTTEQHTEPPTETEPSREIIDTTEEPTTEAIATTEAVETTEDLPHESEAVAEE